MNSSDYLIGILLIICIVVFLAKRSSTSKAERIGKVGESNIAYIISRAIRNGLYGYVLQNLYVPKSDGGTSEVDVLLVCTKGIFVFESKNYSGYIYGNDEKPYWTVTLKGGRDWSGHRKIEKHKFYNPIKQNYSHILNMRKIVGASVPIASVIVFSDRCELKRITYDSSKTTILHLYELKHYLSSMTDISRDYLSQERVDYLYNKLLPLTDVDDEKKQKHLSYVNELQNIPTKCPLCGEKLVIRTAKKGANIGRQFYGCSNYPKCKYTRNIE